MWPSYQHVQATAESSWTFVVRREERFGFAWHYHPEFELTLITQGRGTRLVGECVEDYSSGDLTLIGPDMPHTYVSSPERILHEAVVIQFRHDFLSSGFFDRPEFARIASMLERSTRGLHFPSGMDATLTELGALPPATRTLALLSVLEDLSHAAARPLARERHLTQVDGTGRRRIDAVIRLLHTEYGRVIRLDEVAQAAHMSPTSLSRFFKHTTGATITDYLGILRVNAACRLLRETDLLIVEVASECGYSNLSNFNRRFRSEKGMAPREYRARFGEGAT